MGSRYEYRDNTKLIGGFSCRLTDMERNEFHEFIGLREEFQLFVKASDSVNAELCMLEGGKNDKSEFERLAEQLRSLNDQLYQIAKGWYEQTVAPRIEAEEAKV